MKLAAALKPDGLFVLERQSRGADLGDSVFEVLRTKRYGGSEVLYLARK
jgi:16S rRNA G966 N2-methylase RsmD